MLEARRVRGPPRSLRRARVALLPLLRRIANGWALRLLAVMTMSRNSNSSMSLRNKDQIRVLEQAGLDGWERAQPIQTGGVG